MATLHMIPGPQAEEFSFRFNLRLGFVLSMAGPAPTIRVTGVLVQPVLPSRTTQQRAGRAGAGSGSGGREVDDAEASAAGAPPVAAAELPAPGEVSLEAGAVVSASAAVEAGGSSAAALGRTRSRTRSRSQRRSRSRSVASNATVIPPDHPVLKAAGAKPKASSPSTLTPPPSSRSSSAPSTVARLPRARAVRGSVLRTVAAPAGAHDDDHAGANVITDPLRAAVAEQVAANRGEGALHEGVYRAASSRSTASAPSVAPTGRQAEEAPARPSSVARAESARPPLPSVPPPGYIATPTGQYIPAPPRAPGPSRMPPQPPSAR